MALKGYAHVLIFFLVSLMMTPEIRAITSQSSIVLENGGYTNVVVAIDESLEENDELVVAIRRMFTDGSRYLYQATRKRVFFKNITILIPSNWTRKPEYRSPGRLTFDVADIIVAPPNPLWDSSPYTHQVQGCGKPGSYIHFVEEFFTSPRTEDIYGKLGRVLVHEWGHLRWGLFNEYPDPVGDQNDLTYFYQSMEDEKWKPVACSLKYDIEGFVKVDSQNFPYRPCQGNEYDGYEEGCLSFPTGAGTSTGSIMFGQLKFDNVVNFCDNDTSDLYNLHNREAPNKQNRLCDSRSAWEVIREHDDFKEGNSPPSDLSDTDILPSFILAQAREADDCRIVLVIDTSGSMNSNERISKAIGASSAFIDLVTDGTWVGIVTFDGSASIRHRLMKISSPAERSSFRDSLGLTARGSTCIGCGLESGMEVLKEHPSGVLAGADILLLSDGDDSGFATHPIRHTVITEGVRVNTLAMGSRAYGELNTVAQETGGSSFSYGDNDRSAELITSLTQTADRCSGSYSSKGRVQIIAMGFSLGIDQQESGSFNIDPSVGTGTQFIVTYTKGSETTSGVTVTITKPDRTVITTDSPEYHENAQRKVINILIEGKAENGKWSYSIVNAYAGTQSVTFSAYSRPNVQEEEVQIEGIISLKSALSGSIINLSDNVEALVTYAEVTQGPSPVLNATVQATVERPGGDPVIFSLLDNGAGADITANDGVYSRSFTEYDGDGYYGISITAANDGNAVILGGSSGSRSPPFINITKDGQVVSDGSIGKYSLRLPGEPIFKMLELEHAAPFTRSSSAGSTNVPSLPTGFTPGQDLFPPNRVQDLRVKMTYVENSTVVLTWTAPGDDLDVGNAMSYDLRISESSALLSVDFSIATQLEHHQILVGNTSHPKPFGSVEEYVIQVPDVPAAPAFSFAFALQASDDAGQMSPVSNVVTATFRRIIPTAPPIGPCDGMVCHNGGTFDESRCSCSCSDAFQGNICQHVKSQLRNGVQINLQMDNVKCIYSSAPLRTSVTAQLNEFCNNNFDTCCPESGNKASSEVIPFVSKNGVRIADGYPISMESKFSDQRSTCSLVVYAFRPAASDLCEEESESKKRHRRDLFSNGLKRSAEPVYVTQAILLEAIVRGIDAIESHLMNTTSHAVSIVNITLPEVEGEKTPMTTTAPRSSSNITVVVVVSLLVVVIICILSVGLAIYFKKFRMKRAYTVVQKETKEQEMV